MGEIVNLQKGSFDVTQEDTEIAIAGRIRKSREALGWTQQDMADTLHVGYERYRKYETRSAFPVALVVDFCRIAGVEIEWLLTGKVRATRTASRMMKGSVTQFKPRAVGAQT